MNENEFDENKLHQWMIESFGPFEGEMAWQQFQELPDYIREQLVAEGTKGLPNPHEVQSLMHAFSQSGMNTLSDIRNTLQDGPINRRLARSLAEQRAREGEDITVISAALADRVRTAASEVNLWLDAVTSFDPAPGAIGVYTRAQWVEETLPSWIDFATPVASSMNDAMSQVFTERFGSASLDGEIAGVFAGPVSIPLPDDLKDPVQLMKVLGTTSYAMQFGSAAGSLSHEVRGTYDQAIQLTKTPAGGIVPENVFAYAKDLDIDEDEVLRYLTLVESAHARLYANVPWLMPRFKALITKYSRSISIDLDAMEQQLRDAQALNPESIAGAVNLGNVAMSATDEQREALLSLETLLALVEGWVDCVIWRAGMPYLPHIEQLREMQRRERVMGGAAEQSFESLLGLTMHPRKMREASEMWETLTFVEQIEGRDSHWSHPDHLPVLADDVMREISNTKKSSQEFSDDDLAKLYEDSSHSTHSNSSCANNDFPDNDNSSANAESTKPASGEKSTEGTAKNASATSSIDWDLELEQLLNSPDVESSQNPENPHDDSSSPHNSDSDESEK